MPARKKIDVAVHQYLWAHGREPRGVGNWILTVKFASGAAVDFNRHGCYGDVLRACLAAYPHAWQVQVNP